MAREIAMLKIVLALLLGALTAIPTSVESMGVCYGMLGDNLPEPSEVISLYKSNGIDAMRLYNPNNDTLNALKGTNISLMVGVPNEELATFSSNSSAAANWVQNNILAYEGVSFKYIAVGNELMGENASNILPAMHNIHNAIASAGLQDQIKVSTSVRFDVLSETSPPSNAVFSSSHMGPVVQFLANTNGPLLVNIYPYFSYAYSNGEVPLDFALFTAPDTVVYDNEYQYKNLFDAMVDSVYYAMEKVGYSNVNIVVSESGWPSYGGVGTTMENAQIYNQNLINHSAYGTPKRPGNLETYIFAMFMENMKTGDEVERHFGLFYPDQSPVYTVNFNYT
ncbi:hypothetical protein LUZ61_020885 [Rhynchospora tenuis]|uniref:Uncharacterized protein n=1 Tax=Rhynchospora tenuis TaxID=198213 RepID=A0AAD5ZDT9_9POAL|nr:hypothetical protein LUZ61_020885 [Rhynchospora tenuis]